jgi:hypothetical protein
MESLKILRHLGADMCLNALNLRVRQRQRRTSHTLTFTVGNWQIVTAKTCAKMMDLAYKVEARFASAVNCSTLRLRAARSGPPYPRALVRH